jgi:hypothetical protein
MLVHALPHPLSRQRLRRSDERGVTLRGLVATGSAFHQACLCTEPCNENQRFRKAERKTSLSGTVFLSPSLSLLRLEVRVLDVAVVLSPDYLLSEQSTEATYTQTVRFGHLAFTSVHLALIRLSRPCVRIAWRTAMNP